MNWILVYKCEMYEIFRNEEGTKKRILYRDGSEWVGTFFWNQDDMSWGV